MLRQKLQNFTFFIHIDYQRAYFLIGCKETKARIFSIYITFYDISIYINIFITFGTYFNTDDNKSRLCKGGLLGGQLALVEGPEHGGPLPVGLLVVGDERGDAGEPGLSMAVL